jgi:RNA polymerase sigma factor (sigma-70 family)
MSNPAISPKVSDLELINSLNGVDMDRRKGEEELFTRYSYFIREGGQKYSLPKEESFNAYADAVLSVIEKIKDGSFKGLSSVKTYLYQIFHNKCVDILRKKTTNKQTVHQTAPLSEWTSQFSDTAKSIIQKLIEKTDFDLLKQKMSELGDNCRQVLLLWADGFSDKAIAAQLAYKTADVVKTSRLRCLDKLRQLYKQF